MKAVAILPAAGKGSRLNPYQSPKELIPVCIDEVGTQRIVGPKPVITFALTQVFDAGIDKAFTVVSPNKFPIINQVGDGRDFGVNVSYAVQLVPEGMCEAIDLIYPWIDGTETLTCLIMPDTIIRPAHALKDTMAHLANSDADIVLGVFITETPELFGPVRLAEDGKTVTEIQDKPEKTDLRTTWGIATWKPSFASFIHESIINKTATKEIPLGDIMRAAMDQGMTIEGVLFDQPDALYLDIGTPSGLAKAWEMFSVVNENDAV